MSNYEKLLEAEETLAALKSEVNRKLTFVLRKASDEDVDKLYESINCIAGFFGYDKD